MMLVSGMMPCEPGRSLRANAAGFQLSPPEADEGAAYGAGEKHQGGNDEPAERGVDVGLDEAGEGVTAQTAFDRLQEHVGPVLDGDDACFVHAFHHRLPLSFT